MQDKTMARYVAANVLADVTLNYPPKDDAGGSERFAEVDWQWRIDVLETATSEVYMVTAAKAREAPAAADMSTQLPSFHCTKR